MGIETLVSMLSSGGSDSEKEEQQAVQAPVVKAETSRSRANMLRKTGESWSRKILNAQENVFSSLISGR